MKRLVYFLFFFAAIVLVIAVLNGTGSDWVVGGADRLTGGGSTVGRGAASETRVAGEVAPTGGGAATQLSPGSKTARAPHSGKHGAAGSPSARGEGSRNADGPTQTDARPTISKTHHPITPEGIRTAMGEARPHLKECFEAWKRADPNLEDGRLVVGFGIESDTSTSASVKNIAVESGGGHQFFESCVLRSIENLRFEAPPDGKIKVRYPFQFASLDAGITD